MAVLHPSHLRRLLGIAVVLAAGFVLFVLAGAALIDVLWVDEPDLTTEWTVITVAACIAAGYLISRRSRFRRK